MNFINEFNKKIEDGNINWNVLGLATENNTLLTLGSDSKLIGRIFELISHPILKEIGEENGYRLEASQSQTVYPDYTYVNDTTGDKIAVDIKTTYRRYKVNGDLKDICFTLGAYGSFIRNGTKNIAYPLDQYSKHYVLGFIYDRDDDAQEGQHISLDQANTITPPYSNVVVFAQEKHKIAGDKPGAGNTENIGSFKTTDVNKLIHRERLFSLLGEDVFLHYWKNHPRYRQPKHYKDLQSYLDWKDNDRDDLEKLQNLYNKWLENN